MKSTPSGHQTSDGQDQPAKADLPMEKPKSAGGKVARGVWMANSKVFAKHRNAGVGFDRWCQTKKKTWIATNEEFEKIFQEFLNYQPGKEK